MTLKRTTGAGYGLLVMFCLLFGVEAVLHDDDWLYRYRSVFAAGRALDKLRYVESYVPEILLIGNSRVDNGFDPKTLSNVIGGRVSAFNLGIPGANARILYGIMSNLAEARLLGPGHIDHVVIGLDESVLQSGDDLGYSVFFANRGVLWQQHEYRDWLASWVRLWGYSPNLKKLREPAKLVAFVDATRGSVPPHGGAASEHLGYRAGIAGAFQDSGQIQFQEAGSKNPPDKMTLDYFWRLLDLLVKQQVNVAVLFPPLLNRNVLYLSPGDPAATQYLSVARQLTARGVPLIDLEPNHERDVSEFSNPGHLNDRGAQRYTRLLAYELKKVWGRQILSEAVAHDIQ